MKISLDALQTLLTRALCASGMSEANASIIAGVVSAAERDGAHHHGVFRLRGYVETLRSGWVDGRAVPEIDTSIAGLVKVDARNGFAQPALAFARQALIEKCRANGIAFLTIRNSHHFAALWPDVEPLAAEGLIALAFVNSRSRVAPWGGHSKLFGTNPMAFACPRAGKPPIVWDQASSVVSSGELLMKARDGKVVAEGIGIDKDGRPTTDPKAILQGGAQLPFGGHKGSMIALMVEILAAALTGGRFGMEDGSAAYPGAQTSNAGETIIAIDPMASAGQAFFDRIDQLSEAVVGNGDARIPGERRWNARSSAVTEGVEIPDDLYEFAMSVASGA